MAININGYAPLGADKIVPEANLPVATTAKRGIVKAAAVPSGGFSDSNPPNFSDTTSYITPQWFKAAYDYLNG